MSNLPVDTRKPNILIIYPDQMRADAIGCMGNTYVQTPNIDRLAREGVMFHNAFTSYPVCSPFRASFLTGRYAHTTGVLTNHTSINTTLPSLATILSDNGYRTGYVGKWHLDGGEKPGFVPPGPRRMGFQSFVGFNRGHAYLNSIYYKDSEQPYRYPGFEPDFQTLHIIEFIETAVSNFPDQPFLAYISYGPPHFPMEMPRDVAARHSPRNVPLPRGVSEDQQRWRQIYSLNHECNGDKRALQQSRAVTDKRLILEAESEAEVRTYVAGYYSLVENIDQNIGKILNYLDEKNLSENTIVVFMSDHGDMLGQHGYYCGVKRNPYREAAQVPLIIRYPRNLEADQIIEDLIDLSVDGMPTLLELCNVPIPSSVHGKSVMPRIYGQTEIHRDKVFYQSIRLLDGPPGDYFPVSERGVRTNKWLYTRTETQPKLLIDIENDPHEEKNLLDSHQYDEVIDELDRHIENWMKFTGDSWELTAYLPPNFVDDQDSEMKLREGLYPTAKTE